MNKNQKLVLMLGATSIFLMLLFPPFQVHIRNITFNMGYNFIFDPPKRGYVTASVNTGMLMVQWIAALALTVFGFFLLKSSNGDTGQSGQHQEKEPVVPMLNNKLPSQSDQSKASLGGQYHPWRRFFARTVDLWTLGLILVYLFALLFGYVAGTYLPDGYESIIKVLQNPITWAIIICLIWAPVEAGFLAGFGATPGKWLFGIRVVGVDGHLLSISKALERSFLVWIQGLGFGIPVVAFFTQLFAYNRLTKKGTTLWDKSTNAMVTHQQWGVFRSLICIVAVLAVMIIMGIVNSIGNQPNG